MGASFLFDWNIKPYLKENCQNLIINECNCTHWLDLTMTLSWNWHFVIMTRIKLEIGSTLSVIHNSIQFLFSNLAILEAIFSGKNFFKKRIWTFFANFLECFKRHFLEADALFEKLSNEKIREIFYSPAFKK